MPAHKGNELEISPIAIRVTWPSTQYFMEISPETRMHSQDEDAESKDDSTCVPETSRSVLPGGQIFHVRLGT